MNHEEPVNEAVDVDARTGIFKRTLTRLEQNRLKREGKTDKYAGLYDDGSGRGVSIPNPVILNQKESKRFPVEIDGRIKGLREAMKRVEMYRKLREEKKKKTLMGGWKEEVETTSEVEQSSENLQESIDLTKGQIMDAIDRNGRGWVVKEEELSPAQKKYRTFFTAALKKFGAKSPADLDDEGKKKLFNYVKKNYKESIGASSKTDSAEKIIRMKEESEVDLDKKKLIESLNEVEQYLDEDWKTRIMQIAGKFTARMAIRLIQALKRALIYRYSTQSNPKAAENIANDAGKVTDAFKRAYNWATSGSKVEELPKHFPPAQGNPQQFANPVITDFVKQNYGKFKIVNNRLVKIA